MQTQDYFQVVHDKGDNEWRIHVSEEANAPAMTSKARRFHEGKGDDGLRTAVNCYRAVASTVGAGFKVIHHLPNGNVITEVFEDDSFDHMSAFIPGMPQKRADEIDLLSN